MNLSKTNTATLMSPAIDFSFFFFVVLFYGKGNVKPASLTVTQLAAG